MGINVDFKNAIGFETFLYNAGKKDEAIIADIMNGKIKTEAQRKERHDALANESFDILPDSWRVLANKKDKTQEEYQRMAKEYQQGFTDFGNEYVKYIDAKYGNGDGVLTKNEYIEYEVKTNSVKDDDAQIYAGNVFSHLDQNKDGTIDKKEMASMFSMLDMSIGQQGDKAGGINGRLKVCDIRGNLLNLVKPSGTEGGDAIDSKLKCMYNFLYSAN